MICRRIVAISAFLVLGACSDGTTSSRQATAPPGQLLVVLNDGTRLEADRISIVVTYQGEGRPAEIKVVVSAENLERTIQWNVIVGVPEDFVNTRMFEASIVNGPIRAGLAGVRLGYAPRWGSPASGVVTGTLDGGRLSGEVRAEPKEFSGRFTGVVLVRCNAPVDQLPPDPRAPVVTPVGSAGGVQPSVETRADERMQSVFCMRFVGLKQ